MKIYYHIGVRADPGYALNDGHGIMQVLVDLGFLTQELRDGYDPVDPTFSIFGWYRWTPPSELLEHEDQGCLRP